VLLPAGYPPPWATIPLLTSCGVWYSCTYSVFRLLCRLLPERPLSPAPAPAAAAVQNIACAHLRCVSSLSRHLWPAGRSALALAPLGSQVQLHVPWSQSTISSIPWSQECNYTRSLVPEYNFPHPLVSECNFTLPLVSECNFTRSLVSECNFTRPLVPECNFTRPMASDWSCKYSSSEGTYLVSQTTRYAAL
jgi:hypothetical protein